MCSVLFFSHSLFPFSVSFLSGHIFSNFIKGSQMAHALIEWLVHQTYCTVYKNSCLVEDIVVYSLIFHGVAIVSLCI